MDAFALRLRRENERVLHLAHGRQRHVFRTFGIAWPLYFRAFGLPVPAVGAFLLQGIIGFGVALPSSPGYVGVFEAATRATLALYGIDATRAVSYAVAYHASTFLPVTLLGLYSLSRLRLHLAELRTATATDG